MARTAPRSGARRRPATLGLTALIACAIGSVGSVQAEITGATAAGFADTTAGIHLWAPLFMTGGRFQSRDEAIAAARRFDVIAGLPGQLAGYLPDMRSANPRLRAYVYINGTYLHPPQLGDLPSWVMAHDVNGDLIRSNQWGNYLGAPSLPRWVAYKQAECADALAVSGADGCYLDMLGAAPVVSGYGTGLPINPATGSVLDEVGVADRHQRPGGADLVVHRPAGTGQRLWQRPPLLRLARTVEAAALGRGPINLGRVHEEAPRRDRSLRVRLALEPGGNHAGRREPGRQGRADGYQDVGRG